jgi:hypothetical protein
VWLSSKEIIKYSCPNFMLTEHNITCEISRKLSSIVLKIMNEINIYQYLNQKLIFLQKLHCIAVSLLYFKLSNACFLLTTVCYNIIMYLTCSCLNVTSYVTCSSLNVILYVTCTCWMLFYKWCVHVWMLLYTWHAHVEC